MNANRVEDVRRQQTQLINLSVCLSARMISFPSGYWFIRFRHMRMANILSAAKPAAPDTQGYIRATRAPYGNYACVSGEGWMGPTLRIVEQKQLDWPE